MADTAKDRAEELETIAGRPIRITDGTVIHMRLFHSACGFNDLWAEEHIDAMAQSQEAAKQFIAQLGDYWNAAFLMALRSEITKVLDEHDGKHGTSWATSDTAP